MAASLAKGTLYEVMDHLGALLDTVDMADTPELRAECEREIQQYVELQIAKVDGIASYLAHCEAQQAAAAAEMERLTARRKRYEARQERLEQYVIGLLEQRGEKKIEGRSATLALHKNPASVAILNEADIPEQYRITKTVVTESLDKRAIKQDLACKREVPGAMLVTGKHRLARS